MIFEDAHILVILFESGKQRYTDDVVVMLFGFAIQHRSLFFGEGEGG